MNLIKDCTGFWALIIFGNIENLILASQAATSHVNQIIVLLLTLICVIAWLLLGKYATKFAIKYSEEIEIIGGVAIILLGIEAMLEAFGFITI